MRWKALIVIAISQLMVVLDASIVNIALPAMQSDLHISDANRQWVVTAYTLAFGGLLLLGGRIADYAGRKRMLVVGLVGFAIASALGGVAQNEGMLIFARGLQGVMAALLAPAALSLITTTFTDSKERAKAFGVYGALSGGGAAIGLIMGGLLVEYTSWHWVLLVNIPIAVVAVFLALAYVHESKATGNTKYDIPGAITGTLGIVSVVYGISKATADGWTGGATLGFIGFGLVVLAIFLVIEAKTTHPLLPLSILLNRNRGGAYLASFFVGIGMFAMFLFLSYFFQAVLGYSALKSGLLFLPFSVGVVISAGVASQLLPRFGPRWVTFAGFVLGVIGMFIFTQMAFDAAYWPNILPGMIIMSLGMGLIFVPLSAVALFGIGNHDAGVASAVLNTSQQIGGSVGLAFLNTIAASATTAYVVAHMGEAQSDPAYGIKSLVYGFDTAFWWSLAILAVAGIIWVVLVNMSKEDMTEHDADAVMVL